MRRWRKGYRTCLQSKGMSVRVGPDAPVLASRFIERQGKPTFAFGSLLISLVQLTQETVIIVKEGLGTSKRLINYKPGR